MDYPLFRPRTKIIEKKGVSNRFCAKRWWRQITNPPRLQFGHGGETRSVVEFHVSHPSSRHIPSSAAAFFARAPFEVGITLPRCGVCLWIQGLACRRTIACALNHNAI